MPKAERQPNNKYAARVKFRSLRWLLEQPVVGIAIHWTFQSMLYMDKTERLFKLSIDIILGVIGWSILINWLPWQVAGMLAFILAHTVNLLINGQLWVLLKHYGLVSISHAQYESYVTGFKERAHRANSVQSVLVFGSVSRDEWSPSSDFDVRIVPFPGRMNAVRACWFLLCERYRALRQRFPLDAYVVDSINSIHESNLQESPILLVNQK